MKNSKKTKAELLVELKTLRTRLAELEKSEKASGQVEELRKHRDLLEKTVGLRTGELMMLNQQLQREIAMRKGAEEAVQKSESLFCSTLASVSDAAFMTDYAGTFVCICPKGKSIFGYSVEEIQRLGNMKNLFGEAFFDRFKLDALGEARDIEWKIVDKTSKTRILRLNVKKITDHHAILYVCHDITEFRRIEEELRRLVAILEQTPDLVGTSNLEGNVLYFNKAARQFSGTPEGADLSKLKIPQFHPKWARDLVHNEGIPKAIEESVWSGETAVLKYDGEEIPVSQVILSHKSPEGKVEYLSTIARDITHRKKLEQALLWEARANSALAELSSGLVKAAPIEDISSLVLEYAKKLTRSTSGFVGYIDPLTGYFVSSTLTRDAWEACQVEDKTIVFEDFGAHTGLPGWVLEKKKSLLCNKPQEDPRSTGVPKGHIPIHRFLGVPALMGKMLVGMVAVANSDRDYDVRDLGVLERMAEIYAIAIQRKRTEDALRKSETRYRELSESLEETVEKKMAELRQAETLAAIGQVVSMVVHEIRNPLQNVEMGIDALQKAIGEDEEKLGILEEIRHGANLMDGIVRELLDYAGPVRLKRSLRTIRDIVVQALGSLSHKLQNVSIYLDLEPREISVDGEKMIRVFVNLISNAVDAMPNGGNLRIYSERGETGGKGVLRLYVSDTGFGISEELLERVQQPFFTTKTRGTGLGISICKRIVDAHNGSLRITSKASEGTTVEIILPIETP